MFAWLGYAVTRHWRLVILAWIALAAVLWVAAPRWDDVTLDGDLAHLPPQMPSIRGQELLERAFPQTRAQSQIVIVVAREDEPLRGEDQAVVAAVADRFRGLSDELPILEEGVWTPATEVVGRMLTSRDHQAALVVLQLANEFMATDNIRVLNRVEEELDALRAELPPGLQLGVSGSAAIGGDMLYAATQSISRTERFTVVLVVAILLIVYRAPVLVVVPLASIAASVFVATHVVAMLTQIDEWTGWEAWDFHVFKTTKIFIVVILYGAGTDYCLFLISRYKEELRRGMSHARAVARSLANVGDALAASALTTIVGLATMYFADFGKYKQSGPAIAVCLLVALAACVTLAPAILLALGNSVFWPFKRPQVDGRSARRAARDGSAGAIRAGADSTDRMGRFWQTVTDAILARPGLILVTSVLLMSTIAWRGRDVEINYDLLSELGHERPSVRGTAIMRRHFSPGETGPLKVVVAAGEPRFGTEDGEHEIARLTKLLYDVPGVGSVRSVAEPTGDQPGKVQPFTRAGLAKLAAKRHPLTKARFVTTVPELAGRVARFDLVLEYDPFSAEAIDVLNRVESKLVDVRREAGSAWNDAQFGLAGTTSGIRDLKSVTESDRVLIQRLVVVAVLAVLLVILRHPVICVYLILSVLFSYFVTMGITEAFFQWQYGDTYQGLNWKVPLFLFVILIAIGEDYNIYLATRVFEEQKRHGPMEGLRQAVVRTGGIITSCGVIMAGTFVSMMTGTLRGITELGFALSLGVLLDTFVVRTVLVPAFLALLARRQQAHTPLPEARDPEPREENAAAAV